MKKKLFHILKIGFITSLLILTSCTSPDHLSTKHLNERLQDKNVVKSIRKINILNTVLEKLREKFKSGITSLPREGANFNNPLLTDMQKYLSWKELLEIANNSSARSLKIDEIKYIKKHWAKFISVIRELDIIKLQWTPYRTMEFESSQIDKDFSAYDQDPKKLNFKADILDQYHSSKLISYYAWVVQYYHSIKLLNDELKPGFKLAQLLNDRYESDSNVLLNDLPIDVFGYLKYKNGTKTPSNTHAIIQENVFSLRAYAKQLIFNYLSFLPGRQGFETLEDDYKRSVCAHLYYCELAYQNIKQHINGIGSSIWSATLKGNWIKTKIANKLYGEVWFPVQRKVAHFLGDFRYGKDDSYFITERLITKLKEENLRSGDIMLIRRNWFASNLGLPGFWPHSALYIGSPEELNSFLNGETGPDLMIKSSDEIQDEVEEVQKRYNGNFVNFIQNKYPEKFKKWSSLFGTDPNGLIKPESIKEKEKAPSRVIEAISEGVVFTSIEHTANADYLAVLRPNPKVFKRLDIAMTIETAISKFHGRPYDWEFNFETDNAIVCTELLFKSWGATNNFLGTEGDIKDGFTWKLITLMGRKTLPANSIAEQFSITNVNGEFKSMRASNLQPLRPLKFVAFIDSLEETGESFFSNEKEFLKTWNRSQYSWELD